MAFTLKLDALTHDIHISDGHFVLVHGPEEVCQRIKVSIYHLFNEYFLNRSAGYPWYDGILGSKLSIPTLQNLIRKKIKEVPGVISVVLVNITRIVREYKIAVTCQVQNPSGTTGEINIDNIWLGTE